MRDLGFMEVDRSKRAKIKLNPYDALFKKKYL